MWVTDPGAGWPGALHHPLHPFLELPLFSPNGRVPLRKETVALFVAEIGKAMWAAGELERGPFR